MVELRDWAPDRLRRLTRAEYDRMVEVGLFDEDERVELLCGLLVAMSPQKPPHAGTVGWLTDILVRAVAGRAHVRCQLPLVLTDDSEPEPDLSVVPPGDYRKAHPTQAWLIVEVADASADKDRRIKAAVYARAGVPEYWLVDLALRVVLVHRRPEAEGYAEVTSHRDGELRLAQFRDVAISVAELFG